MAVTRRFESDRYPYLLVHVRTDSSMNFVEALLDTGFDGDISIPASYFQFGPATDFDRWELADGSVIHAPYVPGTIIMGPFDPIYVAISVFGSQPLVGRGVADRFSILLDHGKRIVVEA